MMANKTKKEKEKEKEKITLTKEQIISLMPSPRGKPNPLYHPNVTIEKKTITNKDGTLGKQVFKEEFIRYVKPCGSSGHIGVSKAWVNKLVRVNMEDITD